MLTVQDSEDVTEVQDGRLRCDRGHAFPVVAGIPRFLDAGDATDAESIHTSFSSEWAQFDYDGDRAWGQDLQERREIALRELDCEPDHLKGKLVLDAGCGAGLLSHLLVEMGAEVVSADISRSVDAARHHFAARGVDRLHFIQTDLARPPLQRETFDLVFSGGVLHHNPDTRVALEAITGLVAPGGQIYVWLYGPTPGIAHRLRGAVRRVMVDLPPPLQRGVLRVWTVQSIGRQHLRRVTGRARPHDGVTYREKLLTLLDHYTPRYRWEHTPEELAGWYRALGFSDIKTTEVSEWGFGVLARRSGERSQATAELTATA